MNIFIDFDRTLYDTDSFLSDLQKVCFVYGIDKELFLDEVNKIYKGLFNCYKLLDNIYLRKEFNKELYNEFRKVLSNGSKYIFNDVISSLKILKKNNYKIILITYGDESFQKEKIIGSNILEYIDDLIISQERKYKLDLDYKNSIFLDDNPIELKGLLNNKAKVIRINRKDTKYSNISMDDNVTEFNDLNSFIKSDIILQEDKNE